MWGILIPLLIGVAIGYFSPGRQDKSRMFVRGLLWSVLVAIVVIAIGKLTNTNPLGFGDASFLGLVISFAVALAIMMLGVWIGDMLEARRDRKRGAAPPRV